MSFLEIHNGIERLIDTCYNNQLLNIHEFCEAVGSISLAWNQTQFMVGLFILQKMASSTTQLSHGAVLKQLPADHWV